MHSPRFRNREDEEAPMPVYRDGPSSHVHILEQPLIENSQKICEEIRQYISKRAQEARKEDDEIDARMRDIELTESMEDLSYPGFDDDGMIADKTKLLLDLRDHGKLDEQYVECLFKKRDRMRRELRITRRRIEKFSEN